MFTPLCFPDISVVRTPSGSDLALHLKKHIMIPAKTQSEKTTDQNLLNYKIIPDFIRLLLSLAKTNMYVTPKSTHLNFPLFNNLSQSIVQKLLWPWKNLIFLWITRAKRAIFGTFIEKIPTIIACMYCSCGHQVIWRIIFFRYKSIL